MKSGVPWSVKGVEPEAREAAKAKARRAGLTLGAWLNQVIRDTGGTELPDAELRRWVGEDDEPELPAPGADLGEITERIASLERLQSEANHEIEQALETLAIRLAKVSSRPADPTANAAVNEKLAKIESEGQKRIERLSREIGMLANRYNDIDARIELNRQELTDSLERMARRPAAPPQDTAALAKIQSALSGMEGRLELVSRDARSAATTFEQALRAVMERVVTGEKRQNEQARGFERALDGLAGRVQQVMDRDDNNEAEAVRALEHAVGEITQHFEVIEKRRERASRAVEDAIKNLTERLAESDRRNAEHMNAPLEALDRAVQRMTERIDETDTRTEAAVSALGDRLDQTDERTHSALTSIGKRLQDSEERVKSTFAAMHKRFQDFEERAQRAFAAIEEQAQQQSRNDEGTLAAIDGRLLDIAERIDQSDTETKASRLALMRALDETQRRVRKLEDRPYYIAEPEPEDEEPEHTPEHEHEQPPQASAFASYVEAEETRLDEEAPERAAAYDEPSREAALDVRQADETDEDVSARAAHIPLEEPPPFKTSETVWTLLAQARAAARADAGQIDQDGEAEAGRLDLRPDGFGEEVRARAKREKAKGSWVRTAAVSALALAVIGFSVWQIAARSGQDTAGRPGFMRSLIDLLDELMSPKPKNAQPGQSPVHVTQGAPAPALPPPEIVPRRPIAAGPSEPAEPPKQAANPLQTAKLEPPPAATEVAPKAQENIDAKKAIEAVRASQNADELQAALAELTKAAESGDAESQFTLGRIYETGRGVKTNLTTAQSWYLKAADQGHVAAAFNLGMIEAQSGTREGYGHAARWFDQAARKGLVDAQFNLGMLYAQGLGIGRDPVEAFAWFSAAAAQGDAGAAAERDRIGQALDEASRNRGEALARQRSAPATTNRG